MNVNAVHVCHLRNCTVPSWPQVIYPLGTQFILFFLIFNTCIINAGKINISTTLGIFFLNHDHAVLER